VISVSRLLTAINRTMTEVLLLDASVWVATVDGEDRYEPASRELVADRRRNIAALDLTLYEVANAVGSKRARPRTAARVCRSLEDRCVHAMVRVDSTLVEATATIAVEHRLTSYDAAYVAVARCYGWRLVSTDIADLVSKGLAVTPDAAV
jgi:predicted nucleic acid-binding protein